MRKLYGYYRSSAAYRVRIALALKGLEYEQEAVNLLPSVSGQKTPEFLAINPQGRVPFFVDGDVRISQSTAILEYLDEAYLDVPLLPVDLDERARVRQLVNLIACDIHPLLNLSVTQALAGDYGVDKDGIMAWYHRWMPEGFRAFEALLAEGNSTGKFCHGDTPGMADLYLVPQLYNARRFNVPLEAYPNILRIDATCEELEAFKIAVPENQPDAPKG